MNTLNHVGIILDGNGRWAKERNLPRSSGHKEGASRIKELKEFCLEQNIPYLSLYCFSTENFSRPKDEVDYLFSLAIDALKRFENDGKIKLIFSGRKDRIPSQLKEIMAKRSEETKENSLLTINICLDYGALWDIKEAIIKIKKDNVEISENTIFDYLSTNKLPHVDMLIRTGKEKRLSNFMLLECGYAELVFRDCYFPDFTKEEFKSCVSEFMDRKRRFGGLNNE